MEYRPPSARDVFDPDLDTLHEHVMPWMVKPLRRWLSRFMTSRSEHGSFNVNVNFVENLEMETRQYTPFVRASQIMDDVEQRMKDFPMFGIDAAAYALSTLTTTATTRMPAIQELEHVLARSGSVWEVTPITDEITRETRYILTRRDLAAAKAAISEITSQHDRAGRFLFDAWKAIASTDPQPNEGYDKAVKAIEAAAGPVITPNDRNATLGKMIGAMRDKPEKWTFVLGNDICPVIRMAERVWGEHFRHGTDERRTDHTLPEADAAVHLAIPLVRYFSGGLMTLNP